MADAGSSKRLGIALAAGVVALAVGWRACEGQRRAETDRQAQGPATPSTADAESTSPSASSDAPGAPGASGLSAPIAAAHLANGNVIVAGLDVSAKAIRVQRIDVKDAIVAERVALDDVAWSPDSELKVSVHATQGVAVTWRGLRGGKLVRELVLLGPDLAPSGEPEEVAAASCVTRDALWFSDDAQASSRPWSGASLKIDLPKEKDVSLLCGASHAFAVLGEEDHTSILPLGAPFPGPAGTRQPLTVVREGDFGDDEQRELAQYTVGDDVGVVRIGGSGAVAVREIVGGVLGPLRKLKATIPKDDDVVAVDASPKVLAIVYTEDASASCPPGAAGPGDGVVATKVMSLRVDRETLEESTTELAPGRCGHEIGPFFTDLLGDDVAIAWTERSGGAGSARAPITGIAHALVARTGRPAVARTAQPADALVDAGCDGTHCYAAALVRRDAADASAPGFVKVLRYK